MDSEDSSLDLDSEYLGAIEVQYEDIDEGGAGIVINLDDTEAEEIQDNDNRMTDPDFSCSEQDLEDVESESEGHSANNSDTHFELEPTKKKRKVYTNKRKPISKAGGRKKDPIWEHFEEEPRGSQGRQKYKCKICRQGKLSGEAQRLRQHYDRCSKRDVIDLDLRSPISVTSNSSARSESFESSASASVSREKFKIQRQSKLSVCKTSRTQQEILDSRLAKFVYSTNSPFSIVKNQEFKDFVKEMRPSYIPPSEQVIGSSLLETVFTDIKNELFTELKTKEVVMQQDGWSSCQNEPIIAHSVTVGNRNYFINADKTGAERKSAEFCQALLETEILKVEKEYGCSVIGCVTDNCSTMKKMRENMKTKFPNLFFYGCNSHLLNLVGQDLTPKPVIHEVVKVQKYFRQHHFEAGSLMQLHGNRPVIPGDTRWNSQVDTLESFLSNHAKYLQISRDKNSKMSPDIRSTIEDINFFKKVESAVTVIKPVQVALDKLQGDQSTLADAVNCWIGLTRDLKEYSNDVKFLDRMQTAIGSFAVAAYMLHPVYRGKDLSDELFDKGNNYLCSLNPLFVIGAANLKLADTSFYPSAYLKADVSDKMSPANWWASVSGYQRLPIGLSQLAQKLMKLPSSSAGIERCFSALGNIMTTKRSRLDVDKGYKLCFIYQYFRNKNKDEVYIETELLD